VALYLPDPLLKHRSPTALYPALTCLLTGVALSNCHSFVKSSHSKLWQMLFCRWESSRSNPASPVGHDRHGRPKSFSLPVPGELRSAWLSHRLCFLLCFLRYLEHIGAVWVAGWRGLLGDVRSNSSLLRHKSPRGPLPN